MKNPRSRITLAALPALAAFAILQSASAQLPTSHSFTVGSGTVVQSGNDLNIDLSGASVMQWDTYNIDQGYSVNYTGGDSLNFVNNGSTTIDGLLTSTHKVFLVNPSGIVIGATGVIDAAGFVATTMPISSSDFLVGTYQFDGTSVNGVVNNGSITADIVVLVADTVRNVGGIAGGDVTLGATTSQLIVDPGTGDWSTSGMGTVINEGSISASGVSFDGGRIRLVSDTTLGSVTQSGTLEVDGGTIETSGGDIGGVTSAPVTNGREWILQTDALSINGFNVQPGELSTGVISAALTSGSSATLKALSGDIDLSAYASIKPVGASILTLDAANAINLAGQVSSTKFGMDMNLAAGGNISFLSGANINIGPSGNLQVNAGATVNLDALNEKVLLTSRGGDISISGQDVTITNHDSKSVEIMSYGGAIQISATRDISLSPARYDLKMYSEGGYISLDAGRDIVASSNVGEYGKLQINSYGYPSHTAGTITLNAGRDIGMSCAAYMDTGNPYIAGNDLNITAVGDITLNAPNRGRCI